MTQPAKTQEPSMEEILASIRRIISDDEAKPAPAPPPASAKPVPVEPAPAKVPAARAAATPLPTPAPTPAAAPAGKVDQAEIDALMASFDGPASAKPAMTDDVDDSDVFELTEQMVMPEMPASTFHKIEPEDDLEFAESAAAQPAQRPAPAASVPPSREQPAPPASPILSTTTISAPEASAASRHGPISAAEL